MPCSGRSARSSPRCAGEHVVIPLLASDRRQARQALKYIRGFHARSLVAPYVFRGTLKERIEYKTGCGRRGIHGVQGDAAWLLLPHGLL